MAIRIGKPSTTRVGTRQTTAALASQKLVARAATIIVAGGGEPRPRGRAVSRCPTCVRVLS